MLYVIICFKLIWFDFSSNARWKWEKNMEKIGCDTHNLKFKYFINILVKIVEIVSMSIVY